MKTKRSLIGFTLIEVLVVISIISVLAALLFPVFSKSKTAAKGDVCLSNLHQIGLGTDLYAADADDLMPYGASPYTKANAENPGSSELYNDEFFQRSLTLPTVKELLQPYGVPEALWKCPLDRMDPNLLQENRDLGREVHKPTWYQQVGSSYDYDDVSALSGMSLSGFADPSDAAIFIDLGAVHGPMRDSGTAFKNLLFADGHAKLDIHNKWISEFAPDNPNGPGRWQ